MEKSEFQKMNKAFVSGEFIPGVKYRYNSKVKIGFPGGSFRYGWIVGVEIVEPEPIYTIEIENGDPCFEAPESSIALISGQ